jgi:malate permease and related proteins
MNSLQTLSATLPVIFLVLVGVLINKYHLIKATTAQDLKNLVVNITLPLLLFKAFATMQFAPQYLVVVISVFAACVLVMWLSAKLSFVPGLKSKYASFLMAGFEAGMLGYAMFGSIYGAESIQKFAVIDLGQVLFVFFVLISKLEHQQGRKFDIKATLLNFIKSPVILGIFLGILCNFLNLYTTLSVNLVTSSLTRTIEILGSLTTPLVALVIGYQLKFEKGKIIQPALTVFLRFIVWAGFAIAFNNFVIHTLLGLDRGFEAAVLLMAMLPAPFVIPFYLHENISQERDYILNTLSIGTVLALVAGMGIRVGVLSNNPVFS